MRSCAGSRTCLRSSTCGAAIASFATSQPAPSHRFSLKFALAFVLLAANDTVVGTVTEWRVFVFGLRLVVFVGILFAIVDKNRRP